MRKFVGPAATDGQPQARSWQYIREQMAAQYGRHYTPIELRLMELKWRRIFAESGWSVKGV